MRHAHPLISPRDAARRPGSRAAWLMDQAAWAVHAAILLASCAPIVVVIIEAAFAPAAAGAAFNGGRWRVLLVNSSIVVGVAVAIAMASGLAAAIVLTRTDLPAGGRWFALAVLALLACLPPFSFAIGVLATLPVVHLSQSVWLCALLCGVQVAPLGAVLLTLALRTGVTDAEQAALLDASPAEVIRHVGLPARAWDIVLVAAALALLVGGDALISDLLAVATFSGEVYAQFRLDASLRGPLLTAAPTFAVVALGVLSLRGPLVRRLGDEPATASGGAAMRVGRWGALIAGAFWLSFATAATFVGLAIVSRLGPWRDAQAVVGRLAEDVGTSAMLAATAATIVVAFAPGLALLLRTRGARAPVWAALAVLLACPAPVAGVALVESLNRPGLAGMVYDSPAIVVIAYVVRFLAVGVLLASPPIIRLPAALWDAARVDGCGFFELLRSTAWPAARGSVVAAWLMVWLLCFGETNAVMLVRPPGCDVAAATAFELLHSGVYRDLAVLGTLATVAAAAPCVALLALAERGRRREA